MAHGPIGIVCLLSFGDCLFTTALSKAVYDKYGAVGIVTTPKYADAFTNLPWINDLVIAERFRIDPVEMVLAENTTKLKSLGYQTVLDITPHHYYNNLIAQGWNKSLIDIFAYLASPLELDTYDQKPIFNPTIDEIDQAKCRAKTYTKPVIAIESTYFSDQSWGNQNAFKYIIDNYTNCANIIWCSPENAPCGTDPLLDLSRRTIIQLLNYADIFISVGSGFFCSSLALTPGPKHTVCLWKDHFYKYEQYFAKHGWDKDIIWVHNMPEFTNHVDNYIKQNSTKFVPTNTITPHSRYHRRIHKKP